MSATHLAPERTSDPVRRRRALRAYSHAKRRISLAPAPGPMTLTPMQAAARAGAMARMLRDGRTARA